MLKGFIFYILKFNILASTRDILMDIFGLPGWYGVARAIEYNGGRCRLDGWREFLDFSEDGL